jgi:hypothetical protein
MQDHQMTNRAPDCLSRLSCRVTIFGIIFLKQTCDPELIERVSLTIMKITEKTISMHVILIRGKKSENKKKDCLGNQSVFYVDLITKSATTSLPLISISRSASRDSAISLQRDIAISLDDTKGQLKQH